MTVRRTQLGLRESQADLSGEVDVGSSIVLVLAVLRLGSEGGYWVLFAAEGDH
jgi:hypothetical protein